MINLKLEKEDCDIIIKGLAELPAKISFNIINKVQNQYMEQSKNVEKTPEKKEDKKK